MPCESERGRRDWEDRGVEMPVCGPALMFPYIAVVEFEGSRERKLCNKWLVGERKTRFKSLDLELKMLTIPQLGGLYRILALMCCVLSDVKPLEA